MALETIPASAPIGFSDMKSYIGNLTGKFLMKPKTNQGIAGWVFDYEGESSIEMRAEITDHYVEDNTAVQDHMAIRPIRVTLKGFKGELVYKAQTFFATINAVQNRLTSVQAYLGPLTPGGIAKAQKALTQVSTVANQVNQVYSKATNAYNFFKNSGPATTQQSKAFYHFQASMLSRSMMVIDTPWGTLDRMVIEHFQMIQDETTKFWSDISVTLKQLNVVSSQNVSDPDKNLTRNQQQGSDAVNDGGTIGKPQELRSPLYPVAGAILNGH